MGPAFANLLEIGDDQYEYIQSAIINDFIWYTCGDRVIGQKVCVTNPNKLENL
ncbi:Uncharacterised protein [Veillonella atypica]|nr:Uncharacterised protein [Veillonella atypica]